MHFFRMQLILLHFYVLTLILSVLTKSFTHVLVVYRISFFFRKQNWMFKNVKICCIQCVQLVAQTTINHQRDIHKTFIGTCVKPF